MIQVIKHRHSVRTFEKQEISIEDQKTIRKLIEEIEKEPGPFGHQVRLYFLLNKDAHSPEAKKVGMYGYVKNVPAFVTGSTKNSFEGLIDFGFVFERLILEIAKRGFGTVWLSGDFDNEDLENFARKGDVVPVMAPVGYPAYKKSLRERFLRMKQEASDRKSFEDLFFDQSFETPLPKENQSHRFYEILKLVQLAPSALNKQPWRVLVKENALHLYLNRTENLLAQPNDVEVINMGIALRHMAIGLDAESYTYEITRIDEAPRHPSWEYMATIKIG
jgi:nitroreductase